VEIPSPHRTETVRRGSVRRWSNSVWVRSMDDAWLADAVGMNEHSACPECGSQALVASGVFEHGTWILRLTCWTCRDCRSIVAIPESQIPATDDVAADAAP
jgi:hypothetical protein